MDAMGKDIVLVEAVGSGQADVDIALISDTVVLVLNPGAGDEVQMMKAGILETADVFVVNKSDLSGAEQLKQALLAMLAMSARGTPEVGWQRGIVMTEATCNKGIEEMAEAILKHKVFLSTSGEMQKRREERARLELAWAVEDYLKKHIDSMDQQQLARMVGDLAQRKTNPRSVVSEIVARMMAGGSGGFFADRIPKDA
jgi:LAO/AO transport system kinase